MISFFNRIQQISSKIETRNQPELFEKLSNYNSQVQDQKYTFQKKTPPRLELPPQNNQFGKDYDELFKKFPTPPLTSNFQSNSNRNGINQSVSPPKLKRDCPDGGTGKFPNSSSNYFDIVEKLRSKKDVLSREMTFGQEKVTNNILVEKAKFGDELMRLSNDKKVRNSLEPAKFRNVPANVFMSDKKNQIFEAMRRSNQTIEFNKAYLKQNEGNIREKDPFFQKRKITLEMNDMTQKLLSKI